MPTRPLFPTNEEDEKESLRQGTRQQFQSPWIMIPFGETKTIRHELGEIPWAVSAVRSLENDGRHPNDPGSDVTFANKTDTQVDVTNGHASQDYYIQVRAM